MKIHISAYIKSSAHSLLKPIYRLRIAFLFVLCLHSFYSVGQSTTPDYSTLLSQADQAFAAKDYATSILLYEKAGRLKPAEKKASLQIAEIAKVFEASPQLKAQLIEDIVIKAEGLYSNKNYASAKNEYQKALALDPAAQFPKDRLTEISKLYTDPADQAYYDNAVADGDTFLAESNFTKAIQSYETALIVKADSKVVKDKIVSTRKLQSEAETREKQAAVVITAADKLYAAGKQTEAKVEYEKALALTPKNTIVQQKINEINKAQEDKNAKQLAYDKIIEEADNFYINRNFVSAKAKYQAALAIKPDARYAKEMLQKTASGENVLLSEQERYDASLASAEGFLANKEYELAKENFRAASGIKPSEAYPKSKIVEIEKLMASLQSTETAYQLALKNGDESLQGKSYEVALKQYQSALALKPGESYPTGKITKINALIATEKATAKDYQLAIADADKSFNAGKFNESISLYEKALNLKPAETYPASRITEATKKAAELRSKDENYADAISRGDKLFETGDLEPALKAYNDAIAAKPSEKYPKEKSDEITKQLAKQKADIDNYNKFVAAADAAYAENNLNQALTSYTEALKYNAAAKHPADRIVEINQTLALQKETAANYSKAIADADTYFAAKEYEKALESYSVAARVKPKEVYPVSQSEKIDQMLASARSLDENYNTLVKLGDAAFEAKNYTDALASYTSASKLKPGESYPPAQVSRIQGLLAEQKKIEDGFLSEMDAANKLFNAEKYAESIESYKKALVLKPSEKYASDRIAEATAKIEERKKIQEDFENAIAEGDARFNEKQYTLALASFELALQKKPTETYPKQKMTEINGILAKDKSDNELYSQSIAKADAAYDIKKWSEALISYEKAKSVKGQDSYAEKRISLVNSAMAEQKKADNDYLTEVASADKLFEAKSYTESIVDYKKAQSIKPTETYPAQQIVDAEKRIAQLIQQQKEYDAALAEGEKAYNAKDWNVALMQFEKASKLKPNENIPVQKIADITQIITKEKGEYQRYTEAIDLADDFFKNNKLREALEPYQRASTIKTTEKYPQEQIARINQMLAEQEKRDTDFNNQMTLADKLYNEKKYTDARLAYTVALKIKSGEKQAEEKIVQIDEILARVKADEENYIKVIEQANTLYTSGELAKAIVSYEQALVIKPGEKYPTDQIQAIKMELKRTDDVYAKYITDADAMLASEKFQDAMNTYQKAAEIKKTEAYPKQKIQDINALLSSRKEEQLKMYTSYVAEGDRLFAMKDYTGAKTEYTKASGIKPEEIYPKDKLNEVNALIKQMEETLQAAYRKAVGEADKLYNSKVYDQAIEAYETVLRLNYPDPYPSNQIAKIRKYLDEHAIQNLSTQPVTIGEGQEKKFAFEVIEPRLRKNNYVLLKARSAGAVAPKVYLNYGRDGIKNGGIVLRSIDKKEISDYLIRISVQDKWYREDNNWLSLFVETGEIEINKLQISADD